MYKTKKIHRTCDLDLFVASRYQDFIDAMILEYADSRLETDNPDFGALVEEYRHGLMIFAYNDQKVWSQAIRDSVGFDNFYRTASLTHNYNDTNDAVYFWNRRARTTIYTIPDSTQLLRSKAVKLVNKGIKKGWDSSKMKGELNLKSKRDNFVSHTFALLEEGNQTMLTSSEWHKGVYIHTADSGYQILVVEKVLEPQLKSRDEARGYYLNDYQNYLEEQNNLALRKKYNVIIHQDVIDEITY